MQFHIERSTSNEKDATLILLRYAFSAGCFCTLLISCSSSDYAAIHQPNYDDVVGKKFSNSIYRGRESFKKVRETNTLEELEERRLDGCILIFGVRKIDDLIEYWRIDSGPGTCLVSKKSFNP